MQSAECRIRIVEIQVRRVLSGPRGYSDGPGVARVEPDLGISDGTGQRNVLVAFLINSHCRAIGGYRSVGQGMETPRGIVFHMQASLRLSQATKRLAGVDR